MQGNQAMCMTRTKNFFFQCEGYSSEVLGKIAFFQKFCIFSKSQVQNLRLGLCLAMCLKFLEFEAGCAYKPIAYKKKKRVSTRILTVC